MKKQADSVLSTCDKALNIMVDKSTDAMGGIMGEGTFKEKLTPMQQIARYEEWRANPQNVMQMIGRHGMTKTAVYVQSMESMKKHSADRRERAGLE